MAATVKFIIGVDEQRVPELVELLRVNNFNAVTVQYKLFTDDSINPALLNPRDVEDNEETELFYKPLERELATRPKKMRRTRARKSAPVHSGNNDDSDMEQFIVDDHPEHSNSTDHRGDSDARRRSLRFTVKNEVFTPPRTSQRRKRETPAHFNSEGEESDLGKPFSTQENPEIKNYQCQECGASMPKYRARVMDHVITQHSDLRNLECPICHREGARMGNMSKHIKSVHGCMDKEPVDTVNSVKSMTWNNCLKKCFPDFPDLLAFNKPFRLY